MFKIIATDLFYWYEKSDIIQLGAIVERRHDSLAIKSVGKNPNLKGHPPWASDLYVAIMKDTDKNLRLTSDSVQTDQGQAIWKKLLDLGHKVSVFDADKPGKTFKTFDSASELDAFFKDNDFKAENFRYILSETADHRDKVHADFRHRRYRELSGI